jgi:hypothetical protein
MHRIARPRHRPSQIVDRALDPVPDGSALHITGDHQLVRALGGV